MNVNTKQNLQFKLLVATLGVWLIVGSLVMGWADATFYVLAFGLLALTTTLSLIYPARVLGVGMVVAGGVIFGAVQVIVYGLTPRIAFPIILCLIVLSGAAALGMLANRQFTRVTQQLEQQHRLVDELRIYDPDTNLLRYPYALQTLKNEIARSQRYNRSLCVLLLQVSEPSEWARSEDNAKRAAYQQIAELVRGSLRTIDVAFFNATKFGAILPETDATGARLVAERLLERLANKMRLAAHIGIAHFPSDGVTEDELMRDAQAALQLAMTTGQPLVFYVQLRHAVRPAPPAQPLELKVASPSTAVADHTTMELHIAGLRDLAKTLRIEQALRDYLGAENVRTLRFMDGTLILELKHFSGELSQKLGELIALPIEQITSQGSTIHVRVREVAVGAESH